VTSPAQAGHRPPRLRALPGRRRRHRPRRPGARERGRPGAWLGDTIEAPASTARWSTPARASAAHGRRRARPPHLAGPAQRRAHGGHIERGLAAAEPAGGRAFRANLAAYTSSCRPSTPRSSGRSTAWPTARWSPTTTPSATTWTATGWSWSARSSPASTARPSCRAATSATWSPRSGRPGQGHLLRDHPAAQGGRDDRPRGRGQGRDRDDALYGDSLGPPGSDGDTYLKMIRPQHGHDRAQPQWQLPLPARPRPCWSCAGPTWPTSATRWSRGSTGRWRPGSRSPSSAPTGRQVRPSSGPCSAWSR
jgi:hypothetical protein